MYLLLYAALQSEVIFLSSFYFSEQFVLLDIQLFFNILHQQLDPKHSSSSFTVLNV